jgi:hypothetical protein
MSQLNYDVLVYYIMCESWEGVPTEIRRSENEKDRKSIK